MTYWIDVKLALMQKLNAGYFAPDEWRSAIDGMRAEGLEAMAGDLQGRMDYYSTNWKGVK